MRNKDIQMTVINKYGVDKLLHIAYGGWITALFDNLIAMVFYRHSYRSRKGASR